MVLRLGGIAAFMAALGFVIAVALGIADVTFKKKLESILPAVMAGCILLAFCTTKTLFNSRNYRRADIALWAIIALFVVLFVLWLAEQVVELNYSAAGMGGKIVERFLLIATLALSILFAIQAMGFAGRGGRIWRTIGILYLATSILWTVAIATDLTGMEKVSGFMEGVVHISFLFSVLVSIASLIAHGIGLVSGAGKTSAAATA